MGSALISLKVAMICGALVVRKWFGGIGEYYTRSMQGL